MLSAGLSGVRRSRSPPIWRRSGKPLAVHGRRPGHAGARASARHTRVGEWSPARTMVHSGTCVILAAAPEQPLPDLVGSVNWDRLPVPAGILTLTGHLVLTTGRTSCRAQPSIGAVMVRVLCSRLLTCANCRRRVTAVEGQSCGARR